MFRIGEYIVYGAKGVCEVMEVTKMHREGIPEDRLYYVLRPLNVQGSRVYTPVDNDKVVMRTLITPQEVDEIIESIPEIAELEVPSEKLREQTYKDCLRTGDCREFMRVIKTLRGRKRDRIANGKKVTATDERYLKQAEETLYTEFAVLLKMPRENIPAYISRKLEA